MQHMYGTLYAGSALKKLLTLESEHGPLSGYQPAVSEIVDYLNSVCQFPEYICAVYYPYRL